MREGAVSLLLVVPLVLGGNGGAGAIAMQDETHIAWARDCMDAVAPFATEGVGVNFLSQEGHERVEAVYGANYDRLANLKGKYDPHNLFRMNQNIEPVE